ncbi:hypothetical protein SBBP2_2160002 [Burkholderiales bacterium]|nr:hypothetical protein SBBP2_2160002 [Burkholderiales bacterium]
MPVVLNRRRGSSLGRAKMRLASWRFNPNYYHQTRSNNLDHLEVYEELL